MSTVRALVLLAYAAVRAIPGHIAGRPVVHPPLPRGGIR